MHGGNAEALRQGIAANAAPNLTQDPDAPVSVLRGAASENVEFSLILRLQAKDIMQGVCAREDRQGSFR